MRIKGTVSEDFGNGSGLVTLKQFPLPFILSGTWKSAQAPKVGLEVEVELDEKLEIIGIWVLNHR